MITLKKWNEHVEMRRRWILWDSVCYVSAVTSFGHAFKFTLITGFPLVIKLYGIYRTPHIFANSRISSNSPTGVIRRHGFHSFFTKSSCTTRPSPPDDVVSREDEW